MKLNYLRFCALSGVASLALVIALALFSVIYPISNPWTAISFIGIAVALLVIFSIGFILIGYKLDTKLMKIAGWMMFVGFLLMVAAPFPTFFWQNTIIDILIIAIMLNFGASGILFGFGLKKLKKSIFSSIVGGSSMAFGAFVILSMPLNLVFPDLTIPLLVTFLVLALFFLLMMIMLMLNFSKEEVKEK